MTEKLYETDGHCLTFTAAVVDCREENGSWRILLDRTCFAPAAGGQDADTGILESAAGSVRITDVRTDEADASLLQHVADAPLPVGESVRGTVDREPRFRRMQNHSGEHLVSGIVHRLYGLNNVGFHLGAEDVSVDFDGELTREQLDRVEMLANEAVWENRAVRILYPAAEELPTLTYRSKLELTENVRLVEIEGLDLCACCAPHVSTTGEIGAIKILDAMHYKGGERIRLLCGRDALLDHRRRYEQTLAISNALSAKQPEVVQAVERLQDEAAALRRTVGELKRQVLAYKVAALQDVEGNLVLFEDGLDALQLRNLVNEGVLHCTGICAAFSAKADGSGYAYVMGSRATDLKAAAKEIHAALGGRGGGSPAMIQGTVTADETVIRAYFA